MTSKQKSKNNTASSFDFFRLFFFFVLLVVCFQSYTDGEIQYLFFAQTACCQLTITD